MRIMIVDDSEEIRDLLGIIIDRAGPPYALVAQAGDGRAAVDLVADARPDVILLDAAMPVMDGWQALPLLCERAPDAAVIMLSAFPENVVRDSAMAAGAAGSLTKTNLVRGLIPSVHQILDSLGSSTA